MTNQDQIKRVCEAALMVADQPLDIDQLSNLWEDTATPPERAEIRAVLEELVQEYTDRGIELKEVASGYRFQARSELALQLNKLYEHRPPRYSRALLETLAIIAYRQPITRGEIEAIRGVAVSTNIVRTLSEREWVRIVGHRDVPGRPAVYATTREFLDYFSLKSLSELPDLSELRDIDDINVDLFADQPPQMPDQAQAQNTLDLAGSEDAPARPDEVPSEPIAPLQPAEEDTDDDVLIEQRAAG